MWWRCRRFMRRERRLCLSPCATFFEAWLRLFAMRELFLMALQSFQVLFLWTHDWVPLGRLNNVAAVRREDSRSRLAVVTLIQSVPYTIGLVGSFVAFGHRYPGWLSSWLKISYGLLLLGQLRAWWIPYLFGGDAERVVRYRRMFGRTHALLPVRHGIVPNTAHILLHAATVVTLLLLFVR